MASQKTRRNTGIIILSLGCISIGTGIWGFVVAPGWTNIVSIIIGGILIGVATIFLMLSRKY
ncbi:hypothetical protein KDA_22130 [Dictyobacter alpinus]|uniref:Uncharacterized protein n=1 Tax=Dictyobacter alpinus TaxID=2014873 RepID=A0A402B5W8_9CHLR|nr:hypothetical protein KDA_22130 [Dictyobacter alpinus]